MIEYPVLLPRAVPEQYDLKYLGSSVVAKNRALKNKPLKPCPRKFISALRGVVYRSMSRNDPQQRILKDQGHRLTGDVHRTLTIAYLQWGTDRQTDRQSTTLPLN